MLPNKSNIFSSFSFSKLGAHEDGVEGFFKGVGKGLLGLLTKPSGGIFDMVSMAFDGVRRFVLPYNTYLMFYLIACL